MLVDIIDFHRHKIRNKDFLYQYEDSFPIFFAISAFFFQVVSGCCLFMSYLVSLAWLLSAIDAARMANLLVWPKQPQDYFRPSTFCQLSRENVELFYIRVHIRFLNRVLQRKVRFEKKARTIEHFGKNFKRLRKIRERPAKIKKNIVPLLKIETNLKQLLTTRKALNAYYPPICLSAAFFAEKFRWDYHTLRSLCWYPDGPKMLKEQKECYFRLAYRTFATSPFNTTIFATA